jgi:hypothetical protein
MNESVTASGMEIQAKASGNLLISENKLTASDQGLSINLLNQQTSNAKKELVPITMVGGAWKVAGEKTVDAVYGTSTNLVTPTGSTTFKGSEYFSDYTFYLATAGDELEAQYIYINLVGLVGADQNIAPAYTIAFYVDADNDNTPDDDEFVDAVNYDEYLKNGGENVILGYTGTDSATDKADPAKYTKKFTIPSTYGVTADAPVGLRVMMRVYVDGALENDRTTSTEKTVVKVSEKVTAEATGEKAGKRLYTAAMADWKFYNVATNKTVYTSATDDTGVSKLIVDETSEIDKSQFYVGMELNDNWYVWSGEEFDAYHDTTYVNNNTVPTDSTKFSVTVGVKEAPKAVSGT